MTPSERDQFLRRFLAVWHGRPLPDETLVVWHEHLNRLAYEPAVAALNYLERNSKHRPALSELHEAYAAQRHQPERALTRPECGVCEDGWVQTRCCVCDCGEEFHREDRCLRGPGTSARCPNGCVPKTFEEREAWLRRAEDQWRRDRDKRAEGVKVPDLRVDGVRDPSAPNREPEPF